MIPPTLQALVDGWRAKANPKASDYDSALTYGECANALELVLQTHPAVPSSELRALAEKMDDVLANPTCKTCSRWLLELVAKYTPQPPNPHPPGTYLWAREEHARGRDVRVASWNRNVTAQRDCPWDSFRFNHCDFTATDWEVVP